MPAMITRNSLLNSCKRLRLSPSVPSSSTPTAAAAMRWSSSSFMNRPAPPSLPPDQQREFEELQKRANSPMSAKTIDEWVKEAKEASTSSSPSTTTATAAKAKNGSKADQEEQLAMHPDLRPKPRPDFSGDTNPSTGEVGGPKKEPLSHGDWSYGGRVTDF